MHPGGKKSTTSSDVFCKFGTKCTRPECSFLHSNQKDQSLESDDDVSESDYHSADDTFDDYPLIDAPTSQKLCRYADSCYNSNSMDLKGKYVVQEKSVKILIAHLIIHHLVETFVDLKTCVIK